MAAQITLCPQCGETAPYHPADRYCTACGTRLPATPVRTPVQTLPRRALVLPIDRPAPPFLAANGASTIGVAGATTAPAYGPRSGDRIALTFRLVSATAAGRRMCATCGSPLRPHQRFCVQCGHASCRLSPQG